MPDQGSNDPWERLRRLPMGQSVVVRQPDGRTWKGTLVPSHEFSAPRVVQLKLESGYNVGIRVGPKDEVTALEGRPERENGGPSPGRPVPPPAPGGVVLLTTGGTIASRVDYRTGGVRPVQDEREILEFFPDLGRDGPVRIVPVFDRLSEEIAPADWQTLAERTAQAFRDGARGVVIAHGTDTLAYTSAALAFLLEGLPGPVVLVGAQRSPDRPSSDGFTNLTAAVRLARTGNLGEVVVLMHDGLSDTRFAVHRATRVRKMHSSRRDAFRSRNGPPIGWVEDGEVHLAEPVRTPTSGPPTVPSRLDEHATLVWFHPGLDPARVAPMIEGMRGVVIAGTGLGHVSSVHLPWIRAAIARGAVVVMTTQCLEGSVDPFVYATGRELQRVGVLYARDLLPETAYVKLLWALGRSDDPAEVARLVLEDRAGEFEPRHGPKELT